MFILRRPRRNRKSPAIRDLIAETNLSTNHLVYPVFICAGQNTSIPIKSMLGQNRISVDILCKQLREWTELGLKHVALFPQISENLKDSTRVELVESNVESLLKKGIVPNLQGLSAKDVLYLSFIN